MVGSLTSCGRSYRPVFPLLHKPGILLFPRSVTNLEFFCFPVLSQTWNSAVSLFCHKPGILLFPSSVTNLEFCCFPVLSQTWNSCFPVLSQTWNSCFPVLSQTWNSCFPVLSQPSTLSLPAFKPGFKTHLFRQYLGTFLRERVEHTDSISDSICSMSFYCIVHTCVSLLCCALNEQVIALFH